MRRKWTDEQRKEIDRTAAAGVYHDRRARGVCVVCEKPAEGAVRCPDCRRDAADRFRLIYESRKARNVCVRCGKERPARGQVQCERCGALHRQRVERARHKRKERQDGKTRQGG